MIKEINDSKVFFFNNSLDPLKNPFLRSLVDLDHLVDILLVTSHQPCNNRLPRAKLVLD